MSDLKARVGKRLQTIRRSRGVQLAALAAALDISELYLAGIEQGHHHLEPRALISACIVLSCTIEDFMQGI
jgi:transcriptional regulator with XRE-family HTH domain